MKKMIYTLALLCLVFAQKNNQIKRALTNSELNGAKASSRNFSIPKTLSYQGLLTKDNGSPVSDGQYTITFSFYSSLTGGSKLWEEVQEVNIADGIISATLGMSNPVDFASNESYLEISIGDVLLEPRQTLTSVLYSMASDTANYAQGGSYLNLDNLPDLDSVAFTGDYNEFNESLIKGDKARSNGVSAMSVSDMTGIPRATVIRKCKFLIKNDFLRLNEKKQYILTGFNVRRVLPYQKLIFKNKAKFIRKVLNLLTIS